jgi:hypothetical protein
VKELFKIFNLVISLSVRFADTSAAELSGSVVLGVIWSSITSDVCDSSVEIITYNNNKQKNKENIHNMLHGCRLH